MTSTHDQRPFYGLATFVRGTTREITTASGRHGLRMTRSYATDADDLWSAWTDPERMARWLGRPEGDLREGGDLTLWMGGPDDTKPADGSDDVAHVQVIHCARPERLTVRWAGGQDEASILDLRLTATAPETTLLELDHVVLERDGATGYGSGWEDFLARLDAAVAGRPVDFASIEPAIDPLWATATEHARPADLPSVTATGSTSRLDASRWVAAAPGAVWACLSTKAGLEQWYVNEVSGDLAPHGSFRCAFDQARRPAGCSTARRSTSWPSAGSGPGSRRPPA